MFVFSPFSVAAQGVPQGTNISITSSPKFPEPFSPTKLTLEAYGTPIIDDAITWYVDGTPHSKGTRSITLTTSGVSSSTHVAAMVTQGANSFSVETTVTPSVLTILLESSIPSSPFSKEKMAIPAETPFTAIALLDQGKKQAHYIYRWELGQGNTGTTAGQRATFTMPRYETLLLVTVTDDRGAIVHKGGVTLIPADPELSIYSYVNGIASHFPLTSPYIPLRDTESFLAIIRNGSKNSVGWLLNTTPLTGLETPQLLTLGQLLSSNAQLRVTLPYGPFNTLLAETAITLSH